MVKRNEFKKRSRYLAMLTALSLAFSNIGSCVNRYMQQRQSPRKTEVRKDRKLAVRKKTAVLGKQTQEKIPAMILKRADPKKEMETGTTLKAKIAEKKIPERKILEMKIPAKREKALIRESLKREKTLVKTAAKTVLGKINLKKINPKKIRMKTDPGMKAADSLVLKKQIVLKAARVQ